MATSDSGDVFDVKRIRRLVKLMEEHDLGEVDLQQGEQSIRIRRGAEGSPLVTAAPMPLPGAAAPAPAAATPGEAAPAADEAHTAVIKSPMVGTFYLSSSPEAAAYVKVGDTVGTDTTVCIIEAMKVFNEIPADVSGKIVSILVENGDAVEFGQPLFKVDTSG
ncbi:MAG: acetyl-CoA carboxylase biotin carboxyl carrier protein [Planctomycetota bacterium]|nr:MAG: acetyl-CoA carboxylase biotin carboxyl carrier protein [Planctomycetota bacterium]REJ95788.1 MAG: acetyl-CoA carboxylase biotin carboxyl carrier protein [Planctomycetota bacterium]REK25363.1 MAG: acetyl-CoA carboxylase biotin carboxyl carrier protein [Planctomycetota bacterium]REK43498.1 MAG: acetyl-CoA carboxylase biotin carboxyl carrier protein [Planctomycetota bacterium]